MQACTSNSICFMREKIISEREVTIPQQATRRQEASHNNISISSGAPMTLPFPHNWHFYGLPWRTVCSFWRRCFPPGFHQHGVRALPLPPPHNPLIGRITPSCGAELVEHKPNALAAIWLLFEQSTTPKLS